MLNYERTEWYGLGYAFFFRGSVLPRCIPAVVVACVVNWAIQAGKIDLWDDASELAHPYTFQLVGLMFGYLTVHRVNISYNRYWEGVTMVKNMHSKWSDACGQVVSFDRALSSECDLSSDPFCCHIVRLFSQMSAMATMRLHVVEAGESILFENLEAHDSRGGVLGPLRKGATVLERLGSTKSKKVAPTPDVDSLSGASASAAMSSSVGLMRQAVDNKSAAALGSVSAVAKKFNSELEHSHKKGSMSKEHMMSTADKVSELAAGITPAERLLLLAAPCPVFATAQRIQRSIITRLHAGGMKAPPPIISRIFQEISNGLLAYNNATKMKEIPVPMVYVQLQAFFLNIFGLFLCPIAVAAYTETMWYSLLMTGVTTVGFYAIFMVANEMEDPFGNQANDMPMLQYHEEFCAGLCALTTSAWLPEDQWLVAAGKWVKPRTVGLAANAFCERIGRKTIALGRNKSRAVPYDSLLNRQKGYKAPGKGLTSWFGGVSRRKSSGPQSAFPRVVQPAGSVPEYSLTCEDEMATVIQRAMRARSLSLRTGSAETSSGQQSMPEERALLASPPATS